MKVLIVSYYAPPLNAITSLRAFTLAHQLAKDNEIHLITRHWTGKENTWEDMLSSNESEPIIKNINGVSVHYLPYKKVELPKNKYLRKIHLGSKLMKGHYNNEIDCHQFYSYSAKLLSENDFKYIYVTAPPLSIVSFGSLLAREFGLKLLVDFRDLHNHLLLKKEKKWSFLEKLELIQLKSFLKRTLSNAFLVSTASPPFTEFIKSLKVNNVITVLNGFESSLFESLAEKETTKFELTLFGSLYPKQNLDYLIEGLKKFLTTYKSSDIQLNFIGVNSIPAIASKILKRLADSRVKVTSKIERLEALEIGKRSSVLFYSAWSGYKGVYSGKIFEYLGLKRNILIAPGDEDVIDQLVKETISGKIANSSVEVYMILSDWYKEWKESGEVKYYGGNLEMYSREAQNSKIVAKL